ERLPAAIVEPEIGVPAGTLAHHPLVLSQARHRCAQCTRFNPQAFDDFLERGERHTAASWHDGIAEYRDDQRPDTKTAAFVQTVDQSIKLGDCRLGRSLHGISWHGAACTDKPF